MEVQQFVIDHESIADDYLTDLLKNPDYRSMNEITIRAQKHIKDPHIKKHFINKGKEILKKTYGLETN